MPQPVRRNDRDGGGIVRGTMMRMPWWNMAQGNVNQPAQTQLPQLGSSAYASNRHRPQGDDGMLQPLPHGGSVTLGAPPEGLQRPTQTFPMPPPIGSQGEAGNTLAPSQGSMGDPFLGIPPGGGAPMQPIPQIGDAVSQGTPTPGGGRRLGMVAPTGMRTRSF